MVEDVDNEGHLKGVGGIACGVGVASQHGRGREHFVVSVVIDQEILIALILLLTAPSSSAPLITRGMVGLDILEVRIRTRRGIAVFGE